MAVNEKIFDQRPKKFMGVINTKWWLTYVNMKIFWGPHYQNFPFLPGPYK